MSKDYKPLITFEDPCEEAYYFGVLWAVAKFCEQYGTERIFQEIEAIKSGAYS